MKKLYVLIALLGCAQHCLGQGYVNFANSVTTRVSTNYAGSTGYTSIAPNSYYYALFVGPTVFTRSLEGTFIDPTTEGWLFTGLIATNSALPGMFSGNPQGADGILVSTFLVNAGFAANWMVVGWSADIGYTWAAVKAQHFGLQSYYGNSGIGTQYPSGSSPEIAPASLFGPKSTGLIDGFTLYPIIPEPSTFALAGLGATAMLTFRRRN